MGGIVRHVIAALDLAGDALAAGEDIPEKAVRLMAQPMMPPALLRMTADVVWRMRARKFGAQWRIHAKPYEEGSRPDWLRA